MWNLMIHNLSNKSWKTEKEYPSFQDALQDAPKAIDLALSRLGLEDEEERKELIEEFVENRGGLAIVANGHEVAILTDMNTANGEKTSAPYGTIHTGCKAKWTDPDGGEIYEVWVDEIISPELIRCHKDDSTEVEVLFGELCI